MRIIGFGDLHMDTGIVERIPGLLEADYVLASGDLTNFGGRTDAGRILDTLCRCNPNTYALFGNLDRPEVAELLVQQDRHLHGCGRILGGLGVVGLGGSNHTPFATPSEFSEEEIACILDRGLTQLRGHRPFILVSHPPPHACRCDLLASGSHAGSVAVRRFIEQWQPAVCLTGHIHEARGTDRIGECTVVNTGMLREGAWAEIRFEHGRVSAALRTLAPQT